MIMERADRRILGGITCLDGVTGLPISRFLKISAPGTKFIRNRSGSYVILSAPDFEQYTNVFDLSSSDNMDGTPLSANFTLTIQDPIGEYLPRQFSYSLPRNTDPKDIHTKDSVFNPISIQLLPAPTAQPMSNWAVIRASLKELQQNGECLALPWTLIEVTPHEYSVLASRPLPKTVSINESNNFLYLQRFPLTGLNQENVDILEPQKIELGIGNDIQADDLLKEIERKLKANIDNSLHAKLYHSRVQISTQDLSTPIQVKAHPSLGFIKDTPLTTCGMSDQRGEAFIAIAGIPALRGSDQPKISHTPETKVTVSIIFCPNSRIKRNSIPNLSELENQSASKSLKPSKVPLIWLFMHDYNLIMGTWLFRQSLSYKASTTYYVSAQREIKTKFFMNLETVELLRV